MKKTEQNSRQLRKMLRRVIKRRTSTAEDEFLRTWEQYRDRNYGQAFEALSEEEKDKLYQEGWGRIHFRQAHKKRFKAYGGSWRRYAAVLMAGIGFAVLFHLYQRPADPTIIAETESWEEVSDIMPGGNQATLKLPDGRVISLSEDQQGIAFGEHVAYLDGSALEEVRLSEIGEPMSLIMETPRGGNYQVTLADGSQVWLNAESRLIYPDRFDGDKRIVELEGEAYFDVAESQRPFFVKTSEQTVEVLGTEFNVSAYKGDLQTTTTLVTGLVNLRDRFSTQAKVLKPGEQAVLRDRGFGLQKVNISDYIAWKDGLFSFNDTPLVEVLGQLRRWYDFELQAESIPDLHFRGGIRRDVPLSHVLAMLESTTDEVHFEVKDNRLLLQKGTR